jgi:hypothetical protein
VTVTAVVSYDSAHVVVMFFGEGKDVRVSLSGTDGLKILSDAEPIKNASGSRGDKLVFDVSFQRGPAQSKLIVDVSGKFGEETRGVSQVLRVGTPNEEQSRKAVEKLTGETNEKLPGIPIER